MIVSSSEKIRRCVRIGCVRNPLIELQKLPQHDATRGQLIRYLGRCALVVFVRLIKEFHRCAPLPLPKIMILCTSYTNTSPSLSPSYTTSFHRLLINQLEQHHRRTPFNNSTPYHHSTHRHGESPGSRSHSGNKEDLGLHLFLIFYSANNLMSVNNNLARCPRLGGVSTDAVSVHHVKKVWRADACQDFLAGGPF